ncbi:gamma-glutamylcyclotransferase-like [Nymphalis io]|uniref:gamma-glutamylcyclotransferase-like n=1 Tax=Inachis io TaxID=171585 RepID=UPI00216914F1|nr:gamma-glutamylcyclotransferase-like [Nymphalis io]
MDANYDTEKFDNEGKFLYFAYGSNLLERRIHINNPSATFFKTAKLFGYRLDFNIYVESWEGAVATIVEDSDSFVWGALWILDNSDMNNLDTQEGVRIGLYYAKNVSVVTNDEIVYDARTYLERLVPPKVTSNEIPIGRQPSDTYMKVIIQGALECSLPMKYIEFLFTFPTNGKLANWHIRQELGYPFNVSYIK